MNLISSWLMWLCDAPFIAPEPADSSKLNLLIQLSPSMSNDPGSHLLWLTAPPHANQSFWKWAVIFVERIIKVLAAPWQQAVLWPLWYSHKSHGERQWGTTTAISCSAFLGDECFASFFKSKAWWVPASYLISNRRWMCVSILGKKCTPGRCITKTQGARGLLLCLDFWIYTLFGFTHDFWIYMWFGPWVQHVVQTNEIYYQGLVGSWEYWYCLGVPPLRSALYPGSWLQSTVAWRRTWHKVICAQFWWLTCSQLHTHWFTKVLVYVLIHRPVHS